MGFTDLFRHKDEPRTLLHKICQPCGSSMMRMMASEHTLRREDAPEELDEEIWKHLPKDLVWRTVTRHIGSQPIRAFFRDKLVCKEFQEFLTVPKFLEECQNGRNHHESWMVKQKFVCGKNKNVYLDMYDAMKNGQLISVPAAVPLCGVSLDEVRLSSGQGGEGGLIYVEIGRVSDDISRPTREWFVFNPMTKSVRQLRLICSGKASQTHLLSSVDRFCSGYLSWASDGGHEMYPLLYDCGSETWRRIPSDFTAKGQITTEKAVHNDVVYLRYQDQDFKDLLINYNMLEGSFHEVITTGLPNDMHSQHLFQWQGHTYLAVGLPDPSKRFSRAHRIALYELKIAECKWMEISEIPSSLVQLPRHHVLAKLKFIHIGHELIVASSVVERCTDGVHLIRKRLTKNKSSSSYCRPIATCDLTTGSWSRVEATRLGPKFDSDTIVFRPRLDIEA